MWVQLLVSLIVIAAALVAAALFNSTANTMLARVGVALPLLNAPAEASGQQAAPAQGQRPNQNGQGAQTQAQAAPAAGQQGQARQGQGNGQFAGRSGGANRAAVVVTKAVTSGKINDRLTAIG
jgi:hypothetical protein